MMERSRRLCLAGLPLVAVFYIIAFLSFSVIPETPSNSPLLVSTDSSTTRDETTNYASPQQVHEPPTYIMGLSTGHAGSTTVHKLMKRAQCPWTKEGRFEEKRPKHEQKDEAEADDPCHFTRNVLIPFLDEKRQNRSTWIDIGHYRNRDNVLECMADILGPRLTFVRIARNRYDIAKSFAKKFRTPCLYAEGEDFRRPSVSYCPHSKEGNERTVSLPASDDVWDQLTTFQKFLWLADELEYRSHLLRQNTRARQVNISWTSGEELQAGTDVLLDTLNCTSEELPHSKQHVDHSTKDWNCTNQILEDLQYRSLMKYSKEQEQVLYGQRPQVVADSDCMESGKELMDAIRWANDKEGSSKWQLMQM